MLLELLSHFLASQSSHRYKAAKALLAPSPSFGETEMETWYRGSTLHCTDGGFLNMWTTQHSSQHLDQSALFRTFGPISTLQNIWTSALQNIWTNHPSSEHMDQYSSEHLDQSSLYGTSEALTTLQNILYGQIITLQKIRTNQHSTECMEQRASFSRYSRSVRFSRHTSIRIFEKNRRGVGGGGRPEDVNEDHVFEKEHVSCSDRSAFARVRALLDISCFPLMGKAELTNGCFQNQVCVAVRS